MDKPKAYSYIRFSTPDQLKGDSLRRQTEATERYCKENNLILDESLKLRDLGFSAYHGKHRDKGALGEFLKLIESGKIASGSILIVENLDRLSRQEILTALNQFTGIIQAGIKLVTLQDGMEYSKESITENWSQLIISITYMARAHEESASKAKRLASAWQQKRKNVSEYKLTAACPAWLKLSDDKKHFTLIPEVCKSIELIYRKKLSGKGTSRIESEMNSDSDIWKPPVTNRNKTGGWRESYIAKLLYNNRQLIGEYQPHKLVEGKRVPVGESIPDYFPSVLKKELFYAAQDEIKRNAKNKSHSGGKLGKALNFFVHVAKCGKCGAAMHFIDKGKGTKGGTYLHCDRSNRKLTDETNELICNAKRIRYDEFVKVFFKDFDELDISEFIPNHDQQQIEINDLERKLVASRFESSEIERRIQNTFQQLQSEDDNDLRQMFRDSMKNMKDQKQELLNIISEMEYKLSTLKNNGKEMRENVDKVKELFSLLNNANEEEAYNIRLQLRSQIQRICRVIKIYPLDKRYPAVEEVEPGVVRWTKSKFIQKIAIHFAGAKKLRILQLQGYSEINS